MEGTVLRAHKDAFVREKYGYIFQIKGVPGRVHVVQEEEHPPTSGPDRPGFKSPLPYWAIKREKLRLQGLNQKGKQTGGG